MRYRVQLADLLVARAEILRLWAANLPVEGELASKLQWFYRDGPNGPGEGFIIHQGAARAPIGYAGVGIRALWHRGRPLRAALLGDLAIERAHRSGLPALTLVRAVKQHVTHDFDVGYGFPSANAVQIYRRAGCRELGGLARYVRVLRTGTYLERKLPVAGLARELGAIVDSGLSLASRANALRDRRVTLVWLSELDGRFDRLWEEAREHVPVSCQRTSGFLHWRFGAQPAHRYQIAALVERVTMRLRAYAVIRGVDGIAELADLFGANLAEVDALLRQLVPALYTLGFRAASFRFLGAPELPALLARHGFSRRPGLRRVALVLGEAHAHDLALVDPGSWYLTDLDEGM